MRLTDLPFEPMGHQQPPFEKAALAAFVAAPRIAVLTYVKKDGMPTQAPIWYRYEDGAFVMLTAKGSPKEKGLRRAQRACLAIQDDMPPYRAVIVDGDVTLEESSADDPLNSWLATHYFGRIGAAEYLRMTDEENRKVGLTRIRFAPTRVRGFDNHRLVGAGLRLYMKLREVLPVPRHWL